MKGKTWLTGLGAVMGLATACDAGAELDVGASPSGSALGATLAEKAPRLTVPGQLPRPERPTHAKKPLPGGPLDVSALDNVSCESAATLGKAGAVGIPVGSTMRYFKVMVRPGEVVTVRANDLNVWMDAPQACKGAEDAGGFVSLGDAIVFSNEGDTTITRTFSALDRCGASGTFDLSVERTPLAVNARCEGALPLTGDLMTMRGALASGWEEGFARKLYFTAVVPPRSRARFVPQGDDSVIARAVADCGAELWSATDEFANTTDAPQTVVVVAGPSWAGGDLPFSLAVETAALLPEASCEAPRALAPGDAVTFDLEGGGPGPTTCWCFQPESVVHLEVLVPPGEAVRVEGRVADGASVDVQLIELDRACSTACGDNIASGWGDSPASLRLDNPGTAAVTRHLIATAGRVWDATGAWSRAKVVVGAVRE